MTLLFLLQNFSSTSVFPLLRRSDDSRHFKILNDIYKFGCDMWMTGISPGMAVEWMTNMANVVINY